MRYLELRVFVDVLRSLPVQDEFGFVGDPHYVVLHGMAEQPARMHGGNSHLQ